MIKKVLIANRGEIAVRIIRAAKEMGIETVAIYSEADRDALHSQLADEAYCVGPAATKDSYLNMSNIISVAVLTKCDAVHPGYGFLAENADFADLCADCNITFIGPSAEAISQMGTKDVARETMRKAGVPVVPGSQGIVQDAEEGKKIAKKIGYPVIIKATAGGGGKGIRVAENEEKLVSGIKTTQAEAEAAFGDPGVYIEKFIEDFRHVEIQIMADNHGNVIHLGERDCTIQRRLQKLIEESPSPALDEKTRQKMGRAAVKAAKAVHYSGAGTIEFIYEPKEKSFYFMEMNTRIQVEHPVTELVTGIDLVKQQFLVASGEELGIKQQDVKLSGWAMECRINAENPERNFMPAPGEIKFYLPPGGNGVRIDSAAYPNYKIPPFYDSMIAKLICYADTREEVVEKMKRALSEFAIDGIPSTIPFHIKVLETEAFRSGDFNTKFLEKNDVMKNTEED
ncbi:acetyl-CoA carboxylase biotin carboxylase subunit [Listeria fleischmannii]|jgi:acetyl-CoA carboxylase biotin carboxylase subunit|uniref:Biotin carboxylase n=2 Tax=Listeria fleischmannii TaxID=1069827 RepID=W7E1X6_9LIST|nr:acetyl-CoA carboxylase biotin carboxylase subunit [Listeria fleischmannii]EIA21276.1 acetyl-CoA carboxylase biotin carboxylase subunit [Listeria fleischmannii subsp. coloradonensis]EUJ64379.1 acetyl-CoA carboxylase biotin carboxylase subunit [Listeria fleischmannii FSL S10-1203]MBC1399714.1 acetyl-CoA carboxylase biotin carboxylase subunit [Listeria fleischmannii]MBC1419748.1 acetyl-CoA carboxylase biotin carboxylase subunit [Listeria fleischmannii]MBC1428024.1 acetyl-CoA carboxylase biotin